ncbi:MAG TPA: GTP cyclohydrolase II [Xanthomonadales bacterium]|nr:GTP cyclohydrolase II [Xanthomonadales bacterium]
MNRRETGEGSDNLPEFNFPTLWQNPGILIKAYKEMLKEKGESLAERIGECPLPIRVHLPMTLLPEQVAGLGLEDIEGKPTVYIEKDATFQMYVYGDKTTGEEHVAVIKGIGDGENVPIRVHSSCLTAETFHASNCDCHEQLQIALAITEDEGCGGVIWLHQEGRGNGLAGKAKQLKIMMEEGLDTVDAFEKEGYPKDQRDYSIAADILKDLNIKSIRLITNNPSKTQQLSELGIEVKGRISCEVPPANEVVRKDLQAKKDKLGHVFGDSNS